MANLDYIEELGIGTQPDESDTEAQTNEPENEEEASSADFVQEQDDNPTEEAKPDTEQDSDLLQSLKSQIEGMEKRIADKDEYIAQLRESSKQKEETEQPVDTNEEEDFWDNPEKTIQQLKKALDEQKEASRIQALQIQETVYANTVENYWKTVNPESLREAVSSDPEFAKEFNASGEPYKTAYEYLVNKSKQKEESQNSLREQIKQELMKEMGLSKKEDKEVPPNVNVGGSSSKPKTQVEDGFASVFGEN